jgi:hypothetical protein
VHEKEIDMREKEGIIDTVKKLVVASVGYGVMGCVLFSPMLLIVGGAYFGGRYFDRKESKIAEDAMTATATVYDATYDKLGTFLQVETDSKLNRTGAQRHDGSKCTIYYRFLTEDGQTIEGSTNREYSSLDAAKSEIGTEFEVVYSAADPSVYETAKGHTNSQADAMYWIAIAFLVIYVLCVIGMMFVPLVKTFKPKPRKQRIEELKKKQKRQQRT